jgi:hypothetical protein
MSTSTSTLLEVFAGLLMAVAFGFLLVGMAKRWR